MGGGRGRSGDREGGVRTLAVMAEEGTEPSEVGEVIHIVDAPATHSDSLPAPLFALLSCKSIADLALTRPSSRA